MSAAPASESLACYGAAFESARALAGETEAARSQAFARFAELGFPAARDEAWKYTSLRRLEARRFQPARRSPEAPDAPGVAALSPHRIVLVNGIVVERSALPSGMRVRTLDEALRDGEPQSTLLRVPAGGGTERFAALNVALCADTLVVDIDERAAPEGPLHLVLVSAGADARMAHPRVLIRAAERQCCTDHPASCRRRRGRMFVNSFVEVELATEAKLHLYRLQAAGARSFLIERIEATLGPHAAFLMHDAELDASLSRLDLNVRLAAPGAATELSGLFLADGARHLDAHVRVDHLAPDTTSLVDYRGIAAGRGRGVFNGKAVVHVDAQRSNARQTNRNLLLTPGAEIDSKPELEIYADDVKCSHGSTTGQLDPAALFYLRSRGLGEHEARGALTRAFAGAVLSRMDLASYAAAVHAVLDERLTRLLETPA